MRRLLLIAAAALAVCCGGNPDVIELPAVELVTDCCASDGTCATETTEWHFEPTKPRCSLTDGTTIFGEVASGSPDPAPSLAVALDNAPASGAVIMANCGCSADDSCTYWVSFGTHELWPQVSCEEVEDLDDSVECSRVNVEGGPICSAKLRKLE